MDGDRSGSNISLRNNRKYHKEMVGQQVSVEDRIANLESSERHAIRMVQLGALYLDGVTLTSGSVYTPTTLPGTTIGVPNIRGILANFWIDPVTGDRDIYFGSSDDTLTTASQRYRFLGGTDTNRQLMSQLVMVAVGNNGNIQIYPTGGITSVGYMAIFGYWL